MSVQNALEEKAREVVEGEGSDLGKMSGEEPGGEATGWGGGECGRAAGAGDGPLELGRGFSGAASWGGGPH